MLFPSSKCIFILVVTSTNNIIFVFSVWVRSAHRFLNLICTLTVLLVIMLEMLPGFFLLLFSSSYQSNLSSVSHLFPIIISLIYYNKISTSSKWSIKSHLLLRPAADCLNLPPSFLFLKMTARLNLFCKFIPKL